MPYLLIDTIGIKKAFKETRSEAIDMCQHLWEMAKNMALFHDADIMWITFSDSVLLNWDRGARPTDQPLINWITSILSKFEEKINTSFYAIANQGYEAKPSYLHDVIATVINSSGNQYYMHVAGLGDDFANLYVAEEKITLLRNSGEIPAEARIYIHQSLLTSSLLCKNNHFEIKGLGEQKETFYYFKSTA